MHHVLCPIILPSAQVNLLAHNETASPSPAQSFSHTGPWSLVSFLFDVASRHDRWSPASPPASNIRPNCVACFLLHHHNVLSCYPWVILYYLKCSITERLLVLFQIRHCVSYTYVWIIAILRNVVQNRWNVFRFNCKVQSKEFCVKRTLLYLAICIEAFVQWI